MDAKQLRKIISKEVHGSEKECCTEDEIMCFCAENVSKKFHNPSDLIDQFMWFMEEEYKVEIRRCSECGKLMREGYCIEGGAEYYCSDKCLHKHYTAEEWEEMWDDGESQSYYTEWY